MASFIKVCRPNGEEFDYGFHMGDAKAQRVLRQFALHVIMIQLMGAEREAAVQQFINLPFNEQDHGPLTYYGDNAKFVARHLLLLSSGVPVEPDDGDDISGMDWLRESRSVRA